MPALLRAAGAAAGSVSRTAGALVAANTTGAVLGVGLAAVGAPSVGLGATLGAGVLGSFLLADGMFLVLEGRTGMLRLLEASTAGYRELASAPVLSGHDVWGPMALSDGRLVLRDLTHMVCLDLRKGR